MSINTNHKTDTLTPSTGTLNVVGAFTVNGSALNVDGTFTPTFSSSVGTVTTYAAVGYYSKSGKQVTATVRVTVTTVGTASGYANFGNLPFATKSGVTLGAVFFVQEYQNTGNTLRGNMGSNVLTGTITTLTNGDLTWADGDVYCFTVTYLTD